MFYKFLRFEFTFSHYVKFITVLRCFPRTLHYFLLLNTLEMNSFTSYSNVVFPVSRRKE